MFKSQLLKQSERLIIRSYSTGATASLRFKPSSETIPSRLQKVSAKYPFYDALLFPNEAHSLKFNFKELWESVSGLASGFVEGNVKTNEKVVTNAPQGPEHIITQMAASTAGLTFIPVAPQSSLNEIGQVVGKSSSKVLIISKQKNRDIIEETIEYFPTLQSMTMSEYFKDTRYPSLRFIISTGDSQEPGIDLLKEFVLQVNLLKGRDTQSNQISTLIPSNDGFIGYTHSTLINTGDALSELLGLKLHTRVSFNVPFYNGTSYALYLGCLSRGSLVVSPAAEFSVEATLSSIAKDKCSVLFVSGEQLSELVTSEKINKADLSTLTTVIIAGGNNGESIKTLIAKVPSIKYAFTIDTVASTPGQLSGVVFNHTSNTGHLLPGIESKLQGTKLFTKGYHLNSKLSNEWLDTEMNAKINQDGTINKI